LEGFFCKTDCLIYIFHTRGGESGRAPSRVWFFFDRFFFDPHRRRPRPPSSFLRPVLPSPPRTPPFLIWRRPCPLPRTAFLLPQTRLARDPIASPRSPVILELGSATNGKLLTIILLLLQLRKMPPLIRPT
jgi:hypothetical protein